MNETLWKHQEKTWKPRNKQAALITRRANPLLLHVPPPEPAKREPTLAERLSAESKIRTARIEALEQAAKERRDLRASKRALKANPPKPKVWRNLWAVKAAKRMAKSRGLPPPTQSQLLEIRKAQPNYGKPLYASVHTRLTSSLHPELP